MLLLLLPPVAGAELVLSSAEFRVNTHAVDDQSAATVGFGRENSFLVVWESFDQAGSFDFDVYAQRYNSLGVPLGSEFRVNGSATGNQSGPRVVSGADGTYVVVWHGDSTGETADRDIFVRRFDVLGAPLGDELRVNTYTTADQLHADIARLPNGGFVVVWQSFDQAGSYDFDVIGRRLNASGVPTGPEFALATSTEEHQARPAVTGAYGDGFLVAWQGLDPEGRADYDVYVRRFTTSGIAISPQFRVNYHTVDDQRRPSVATLGDDSFVVTWQSYREDGSDEGVFARLVAANGEPFEDVFQVSVESEGEQCRPRVSAGDSSFVVVWESYAHTADGGFGVLARRFGNDGTPQTGELLLNQGVRDSQERPSLSASPSGGFVVAWQSEGRGGAIGDNVYARRYRGPTVVCGDANDDLVVSASDALGVLLTAIGAAQCDRCVCDADGQTAVRAGDALSVLQRALGLGGELACPPCQ